MKRSGIISALLLSATLLSSVAMASSDDNSFGSYGQSITTVGSNPLTSGLIVQADDKLVVTGVSDNKLFVARYGVNGGFDTTFSGDGIAWLNKNFSYCSSACLPSVVQQQDGKLVLVISSMVARLNADGSLDTTFNGTGILTLDFPVLAGQWPFASKVVQQSDGKLVVGGMACQQSVTESYLCTQGDQVLLRLNSDGTLDSSFGVAGVARVTMQSFQVYLDDKYMLRSLILLADGRLLMMNQEPRLISFTANGQLDTTFNQTGQELVFPVPVSTGREMAEGVLQQADGKIVVFGRRCPVYGQKYAGSSTYENCAGGASILLMRFNRSGRPDLTFGNQGSVVFSPSSTTSMEQVAVLEMAGGKLLAGYPLIAPTGEMYYYLSPFNADGALVFSPYGYTSVGRLEDANYDGMDRGRPNIAFQHSGKLVREGASRDYSYKNKVALFRYLFDVDSDNDGVFDTLDWFPADPAKWQAQSDFDADGIANATDNCANVTNIDQLDSDHDYEGDVCDPDDDNDGIVDGKDVFPFDGSEWLDNDHDGIGDNADSDDDNDGMADAQEIAIGSNPFDPDTDDDAVPDSLDADPLDQLSTQFMPVRIFEYDGLSSTASPTAVAAAGDVDHDGYADVVIGYPDNKCVHNVPDESKAAVTTGSVIIWSGKTGQRLRTFYSGVTGDCFGYAVRNAGDVNNDGYSDVIVGAPAGVINGYGNGYARIYSGKNGRVLATLSGLKHGDGFGYSVAAAGDVDKDGYADVIVGMKTADENRPGYAQVVSGKTNMPLYTFFGATSGDQFGSRVHGLGDVDQDGYPDVGVLVVHDDFYSNGNDAIRVYSGRDGSVLHGIGVSAEDYFSYDHVSPAKLWAIQDFAPGGDVDADGYPDIIVSRGRTKVVSGKDFSTINPDNLFINDPEHAVVSSVGDINKDGHDDWAVSGSDLALRPALIGNEYTLVQVISGADNSLLMLLACSSCKPLSFGSSVAGVGDVDGDGYPDIAVGKNPVRIYSGASYLQQASDSDGDGIVNSLDPDDDNDGATDKHEYKLGSDPLVYTDPYLIELYGATRLPPDEDQDHDHVDNGVDNCSFIYNPNQLDSNANGFGDDCDPNVRGIAGDRLGSSIAGHNGINRISYYGEYLVGVPGRDVLVPPNPDEYIYYYVLKKDAGLLVKVSSAFSPASVMMEGVAPGASGYQLGRAVTYVGEGYANTDFVFAAGYPDADVKVQQGGKTVTLPKAGVVVLYSGNLIHTMELKGTQAGGRFGASLEAIDMDGNTTLDHLLVGAPGTTAPGVGAMAGSVSMFDLSNLAASYTRYGTQAGGQFGSAVAFDKYAGELLVGSAYYDATVNALGKSVLLKDAGKVERFDVADGVSPVLHSVNGEMAGEHFGAAVSAFSRDVSGDGLVDWVAGAPDYSATFIEGDRKKTLKLVGKLYMYSGNASYPYSTRTGASAGDRLGAAVCASGDYDVDGLPDLAIGVPGLDTPVEFSPGGKRGFLRDTGAMYVYSGKLLKQ